MKTYASIWKFSEAEKTKSKFWKVAYPFEFQHKMLKKTILGESYLKSIRNRVSINLVSKLEISRFTHILCMQELTEKIFARCYRPAINCYLYYRAVFLAYLPIKRTVLNNG